MLRRSARPVCFRQAEVTQRRRGSGRRRRVPCTGSAAAASLEFVSAANTASAAARAWSPRSSIASATCMAVQMFQRVDGVRCHVIRVCGTNMLLCCFHTQH